MSDATPYRVRMLKKRIQVAWKVLRYGEFDLRPVGHMFTGSSSSILNPWATCQRCGRRIDVRKDNSACLNHPQKVLIVP